MANNRKNQNNGSEQAFDNIDPKAAKKMSRNARIVKWLWISFLSLGAVIALFLLLIYNGVIGYMLPIEELEDPHDKLASVVIASDGTTELGRYFAGAGNRVNSDYNTVSPHVIDALSSQNSVDG